MAVCEVTSIEELRELFPLIEEGVINIDRKNQAPQPRIGADIYHDVCVGKLRFFAIEDEDEVWGWATGFTMENTGYGQDVYIRSGAPRHVKYELLDHLEKAMRADGATRMAFSTMRKGWTKLAEAAGYRLTCYVYTKEFD